VIETILIFEDRPIELESHLARLESSVRAVYGEGAPDARELVLSRARGSGLGRMRLTVAPIASGGFSSLVAVAAFDPHNVFPTGPFASKLTTMTVDRGYGEHKWADRALLSRAEAAAGPAAVPLLVSEAGTVLEASRANVFAFRGGRLLTPPLDGSILPGIARTGVIDVAGDRGIEVSEERLDLDALRDSDEVFLTGSLRGVEPVRALDGEELFDEGPVTTELAAALRRRWLGSRH
jgi:para-aminobenzoate synthetase/4-amino-4-deoxychorismate lyase